MGNEGDRKIVRTGDGAEIEVRREINEAGFDELCSHWIYDFDGDAIRAALSSAYRVMRDVERRGVQK